jgi:hypothetical protein
LIPHLYQDGAGLQRPEAEAAGSVGEVGLGIDGSDEDGLPRLLYIFAAIRGPVDVDAPGKECLQGIDLGSAEE